MVTVDVPLDLDNGQYQTKIIGPLTSRQAACAISGIIVAYIIVNIMSALNLPTWSYSIPIFVITAICFSFCLPVYGMPMEKFLANMWIDNFANPSKRTLYATNSNAKALQKQYAKEKGLKKTAIKEFR